MLALRSKVEAAKRTIAERTKEVNEIIGGGTNVQYDVDWSSFKNEQQLNFLDNISCFRINMALRTVCVDDLAKNILRPQLKIIKLHCVPDVNSIKQTFSGGVWEMWVAYGDGANGMISDGDMTRTLSAQLKQNESRRLKVLKEEVLPRRFKELDEYLGGGTKHIVWDIDWNTITSEDALNFFEDSCFQRLIPALRSAAGESALAKGICKKLIKKFAVKNVDDPNNAHYSFDHKTGTIEYHCCFERPKYSGGVGLWNYGEIGAYLATQFRIAEALRADELQSRDVPARVKEYSEELGFPVKINVDWSTFVEFDALNFLDNALFFRLAMAFRCLDKDLKAAFKDEKVPSAIFVKCIKDPKAKKMTVQGKDLYFECALAKGLDGCYSDNDMLGFLRTAW